MRHQNRRASVLDCFSTCTDPRTHRIQHPLINIITIVVLATLCGEEGWEYCYEWAVDKAVFLERFLRLDNGIPSPDTLRRVCERLDPVEFLQAFNSWIEAINPRLAGQVCVDGKTLRKAHKGSGILHIVSAWAEANRLVLGQVAKESKGKEIPAILDLLETLKLLKGDVVTIDAIGCQRAIVSALKSKKSDYVIGLKANQGKLYDEACNFFDQAKEDEKAPVSYARYETNDHGRYEVNEVWQTEDLTWLEQRQEWAGLASLVCIRRVSKESTENRYYVSSLCVGCDEMRQYIRRHWSIENEYHWHLDVTFKEDNSDISTAANKNLRVARDIGLHLLRREKSFKKGLKAKMHKCQRSDDYLERVLML